MNSVYGFLKKLLDSDMKLCIIDKPQVDTT